MNTSAVDHSTLRVYGNLSLLEMAPVFLAIDQTHAGRTILAHGGVMSLWGKRYDLASLDSSGESDIAANSEMQVLRGSLGNGDLRILVTVAECPYRIIARRSAGIAQLADLRGKRIGAMPHSSALYCVDRLLRSAGLTQADIVSVPFMAKTAAPLTHMPLALKAGEIDAMCVWEPQSQVAKLKLGADAIEFCDPLHYTEHFSLCSTQAKLADPALRQQIVAFVRAVIAATHELQRDPLLAQQLVARHAGLELDVVKNAWPYLSYPARLAPNLLDVLLPAEAWLANDMNRAPRTRAELSQLIDDSVLREALSS